MSDNRRTMVLKLDVDLFLDILHKMQNVEKIGAGEFVMIPKMKGLPADATLGSFSLDFLNRKLLFYVDHESFPEVEPGTPTPEIDVDIYKYLVAVLPEANLIPS